MFTSAKSHDEQRNMKTLYMYILHRLYDSFDFGIKSEIIEKDLLFIPSGSDSLNVIKELV